MTLDIRGSLKNTRISSNPLVVLDELVTNSIDAFLIRRFESLEQESLEIEIEITASKGDLLGETLDLTIKCHDNGCGLGPEQLKAFVTKDTSYKDDLKIPGIEKCKGTGRVQFFHHFSNISISSNFLRDSKIWQAYLKPEQDRRLIEVDDFLLEEKDSGKIGTTITLSQIPAKIREALYRAERVRKLFTAEALKQHLLFTHLQRFVRLRDDLGKFTIKISSEVDRITTKSALTVMDVPVHTTQKDFSAVHLGEKENISANFQITHYKLDAAKYALPKNLVALCAKASIVKEITTRYLKTKTFENNPINGFYHIVFVEGELLDYGANEQRDDFDKIPQQNTGADLLLGDQISFEDIYAVLDDLVQDLIAPPDWSRDSIVAEVAEDFGVSEEMLSQSNTRVRFGDTPTDVARRVLTSLQEKVVDETSSLLQLSDAIKKLEPDSDDFRRQVDDLAWKFTSSLKSIDMANLSQLVVRRSALIDVLDLAVKQRLSMQEEREEGDRRKNEALIHNIFFPMRKDSKEVASHDVWLLSEEYHYYEYISSDKPLKGIKWLDGKDLFEDDIDVVVSQHLAQIADDNAAGRPDLALFHEEGSVVIVEFKAPGVSLDKHDNDLIEYATILAAKSKGRLKKFYGYLIGDTINPIRLRGYNKLPGASGFFTTSDIKEPKSQAAIGQLYSELLFYEDIVNRARKRIGVYRDKLRLPKP